MLPLNFLMITSALLFLALPTKASEQRTKNHLSPYTLEALTPELSGLTQSIVRGELRGLLGESLLWGHNDSGHQSEVFGLNAQGDVKVIVSLPLPVDDVEDIDTAPCPWRGGAKSTGAELCLWLADVGDNHHQREDAKILVFPLPTGGLVAGEISHGSPVRVVIEESDVVTFTARYPRARHPNIEAMTVTPDGRTLVLIEKTDAVDVGIWSGSVPAVDRGARITLSLEAHPPLDARRFELADLEQEAEDALSHGHQRGALKLRHRRITSADFNQEGTLLFVRTYGGIWQFGDPSQQSVSLDQLHQARPHLLGITLDEPQGEALCFDQHTGGLWTGTEQRGAETARIQYHQL